VVLPDPVVVAIADDMDDKRLHLADVVVLRTQPTESSAVRLAVTTLRRLPGCALVAAGVATGGCLLCSRDLDRVLIRTADRSVMTVIRLAVRYHRTVTRGVTARGGEPDVPSDPRRTGFPTSRRGPWPR
jgi:hypothetical protein